MTREEASKDYSFIIKCLNKRRMTPCGFCKSDKCTPVLSDCAKDDFVINKAIAALEKQIPKKPIKLEDGYYYCEHCGEYKSLMFFGGSKKRFAYCPICGQALDWSE